MAAEATNTQRSQYFCVIARPSLRPPRPSIQSMCKYSFQDTCDVWVCCDVFWSYDERTYRVRNTTIAASTGMPPITDMLRWRSAKLFGYVVRLDKNTPTQSLWCILVIKLSSWMTWYPTGYSFFVFLEIERHIFHVFHKFWSSHPECEGMFWSRSDGTTSTILNTWEWRHMGNDDTWGWSIEQTYRNEWMNQQMTVSRPFHFTLKSWSRIEQK